MRCSSTPTPRPSTRRRSGASTSAVRPRRRGHRPRRSALPPPRRAARRAATARPRPASSPRRRTGCCARRPTAPGRPTPRWRSGSPTTTARSCPTARTATSRCGARRTCRGYWNNPEATAETVRPGRWVRTGDFGRLEDGLLFISTPAARPHHPGRREHLPVRDREPPRRAPRGHRVRGVRRRQPGVRTGGQGGRGRATPAPRSTPTELQAFCATELASYKVPAVVELRTEPLPRTASGKVMKHVLAGATNTQVEE